MTKVKASEWKPVGVKSLEKAAEDVVRSIKNSVVIAGPGAGKTELLAQRACYLLQTSICPSPKKILAISFKKDAAENLAKRVSDRCGKELSDRFVSMTFDAFAKSILDRFIVGIPDGWQPVKNYEIANFNDAGIRGFLNGLNPPDTLSQRDILRSIDVKEFMKSTVLGRLPLSIKVDSAIEWAGIEFWKQALYLADRSKLSFPMISRLAEYLLRSNPMILKGLRATYSHVFLDEFQDTTHVQFDLVKTAFQGSPSILTAVGDNKQRIMGWAMALTDAFSDFKSEFVADEFKLQMNYRSSPYLVQIQHHIIASIDSNSVMPKSGLDPSVGSVCEVFVFPDGMVEAKKMAESIQYFIKSENCNPRNICILTKQRVDLYTQFILTELQSKGIEARVEDKFQDLLKEPITDLVLKVLKLSTRARAKSLWSEVIYMMEQCRGQTARKALADYEKVLAQTCVQQRKKLLAINTKKDLETCVWSIIDFFKRDALKGLYPQYSQGDYFESLVDQLVSGLWQYFESSRNWESALDGFEGKNSIPMMTIHKSKGLEFDIVFLVGLEDGAFWSYKNQPHEDNCTFFVALSRAKQKMFFTLCKSRVSRDGYGSQPQSILAIKPLYNMLAAAGVQTKEYK